jgi:diguanylate cyclase (GGDEF)-like protein
MDEPAPRAWRDALRQPHWQLTGVLALACVLAAVLITVGVLDRSHRGTQLDRLDTHLIPGSVRLRQASVHLARTQAALLELRPDQPLDQQQITLNDVRREAAGMSTAWSAFGRVAGGVDGEQAARRRFERALRVYERTQTQSIAARLGVGTDSPTIAQADAATAEMQAALDRLGDRYEDETNTVVRSVHNSTHAAETRIQIALFAAVALLGSVFGATFVSMRRAHESARAREAQHERDAVRSQLETNLQRAFEMVRTEEGTFAIVGDALRDSTIDMHVELLVADSSRAHFRHVLTNANDAYPGCEVSGPQECPATSRTQMYQFPRSEALDACPHLRDRGVPCGAVCVPVSIAGKSIAVLHAVGAEGVADPDVVETLALVARRSGERLGSLRAFARTEAQARTDPLTGLLNRRSLEQDVQGLVEDQRPFVVAYGDVDHFKQLNDLYGHDAGDRALRLFSRVLRDCVRPTDLPARYGGEEFVVVLPEADVSTAVAVVERFREALALALAEGTLPGFTVSFGVAAAVPGHAFSEAVEAADAALLVAKADGRNRVVTGEVVAATPRA